MSRHGSRARKGRKQKRKEGPRFWENPHYQKKGAGTTELSLEHGPKPFTSQYENNPDPPQTQFLRDPDAKPLQEVISRMSIPQMTPKKEEETK